MAEAENIEQLSLTEQIRDVEQQIQNRQDRLSDAQTFLGEYQDRHDDLMDKLDDAHDRFDRLGTEEAGNQVAEVERELKRLNSHRLQSESRTRRSKDLHIRTNTKLRELRRQRADTARKRAKDLHYDARIKAEKAAEKALIKYVALIGVTASQLEIPHDNPDTVPLPDMNLNNLVQILAGSRDFLVKTEAEFNRLYKKLEVSKI